jgi:hypothetical protein
MGFPLLTATAALSFAGAKAVFRETISQKAAFSVAFFRSAGSIRQLPRH